MRVAIKKQRDFQLDKVDRTALAEMVDTLKKFVWSHECKCEACQSARPLIEHFEQRSKREKQHNQSQG